MLTFLRPCTLEGLEPYKFESLLGKKLIKDIPMGQEITFKEISE